MGKNQKILYKTCLVALFSALCYVGVNIRIPLPVGFIHLGNLICVIASLLCGGIVGGLSGSIGMGLFDLYYYGGFTAGVLRTLILKFILGWIAGYFVRIILKKKWNTLVLNSIFLILFLIACILSSIACYYGGFQVANTKIEVHYTVPVFLGILVAIFGIVVILDRKIQPLAKAALTATSLAMIVNVLGEIYLKAALYYWIGTKYETFEQAYVYAMSGIVSVAITSVLTTVFAGLIFYPLYMSVHTFLKYDDFLAN